MICYAKNRFFLREARRRLLGKPTFPFSRLSKKARGGRRRGETRNVFFWGGGGGASVGNVLGRRTKARNNVCLLLTHTLGGDEIPAQSVSFPESREAIRRVRRRGDRRLSFRSLPRVIPARAIPWICWVEPLEVKGEKRTSLLKVVEIGSEIRPAENHLFVSPRFDILCLLPGESWSIISLFLIPSIWFSLCAQWPSILRPRELGMIPSSRKIDRPGPRHTLQRRGLQTEKLQKCCNARAEKQ